MRRVNFKFFALPKLLTVRSMMRSIALHRPGMPLGAGVNFSHQLLTRPQRAGNRCRLDLRPPAGAIPAPDCVTTSLPPSTAQQWLGLARSKTPSMTDCSDCLPDDSRNWPVANRALSPPQRSSGTAPCGEAERTRAASGNANVVGPSPSGEARAGIRAPR